MSKIRADEKGIYVIGGGWIARPGNVIGFSHAYRMDSANLVVGDTVKATHSPGPLVRVKLDDGTVLHWKIDGEASDARLQKMFQNQNRNI